jgi:hypothetical protein
MVTTLPIVKYRGRDYVVDFRLGELRNVKTAKPIRFVNLKEGVQSSIKRKLRGLRSRTWSNEYVAGIDD